MSDEKTGTFDATAHRYIAPVVGPDDERVFTDSGIQIEPVYDADDVAEGVE
jgi:methylmalonyl-CoA mutase, N-terminal domain